MQTLSEIRALLAERGLTPKKALGQNFLHDHNQLKRLLEAAAIAPGELVLEVGPGTGTLTESMLALGAEVIACELDRDMASILEYRISQQDQPFTLVRADCLERTRRALAPEIKDALAGRNYKVVANLPYGCASPVISVAAADPYCLGQFVTIQKEVATRLRAAPGTRAYGPLTVFVGALAHTQAIAQLSAGCFWPSPSVVSAMISITPRSNRFQGDPELFGAFVRRLFQARRKQLGRILGRDCPLPDGILATQRPDALSVEELISLYQLVEQESV
jgi:16S rRNA (adenine1518-N6/adenine1519-N6)-dimethyltransferase